MYILPKLQNLAFYRSQSHIYEIVCFNAYAAAFALYVF
jgi:hypothetical protein